MNTKLLYIHTIGCQMNVYDSEQIAMRLAPLGYEQTASMDRADLIIINTCTVRAKAEQKAFSLLGRLARIKRNKRGLIIGVGGCVAQQEGQKILERMPSIDLVFGTRAIDRLPRLVEQIEARRCRIVDVDMDEVPPIPESFVGSRTERQVSKFVTIMRGCDNYCSYCVVPYVRGSERSRPPEQILAEMEKLAEKYEGVVDVAKVDVDANPALSQMYQIMSIPTIAYFKPGDQPKGVVGFQPMEQLEKKFGLDELAPAGDAAAN